MDTEWSACPYFVATIEKFDNPNDQNKLDDHQKLVH